MQRKFQKLTHAKTARKQVLCLVFPESTTFELSFKKNRGQSEHFEGSNKSRDCPSDGPKSTELRILHCSLSSPPFVKSCGRQKSCGRFGVSDFLKFSLHIRLANPKTNNESAGLLLRTTRSYKFTKN